MSENDPITKRLDEAAIQHVLAHPDGIRNRDVIAFLRRCFPDDNVNTIKTRVGDLHKNHPLKVIKADRGILAPPTDEGDEKSILPDTDETIREQHFYEPFAKWLEDEAGEATVAVEMGGAPTRTKWSNPDVIGSYKSTPGDLYRFESQLIAAEIKINPYEGITAFGQAIAYKLFAHRVYIVMPKSTSQKDISRLSSLCLQQSIGFVTFDETNSEDPDFQHIIRAQKTEPDAFYTNEFLSGLNRETVIRIL